MNKSVDNYRHEVAPPVNPLANLPLTLQGVIWEIMDRYEVNWQTILSRKRTARVSDARHLIASFFAWHSPMSLVEIGQFLGGRDHGTIIHSRTKIADLYETDLRVKDFVDDLEERHLQIEDHDAVIRNRAEPGPNGFNLPRRDVNGNAIVPTKTKRPDAGRKRTDDGRRTMTAKELRESNRELRLQFRPGKKGGLR